MTELSIKATNVGGIEAFEQTFSDPISIVTGENASNKTSLLQSVAFGIGRSTVPIRSGASEARVELEVEDERVVRTARHHGNGIRVEGESFLDDPDDAKLFERFGCLLEFNEIRQAVREERSVEELLKGPMDLNELESRREEMMTRKQELQRELDQLDDLEERIASRESELESKQERIEALESELDELRTRQDQMASDNEEVTEFQEERASLVHERNEHEEQIKELENAVERIESDLEETETALESAREEADRHGVGELQSERETVGKKIDEIDDRIEVLQSVLTANQEMVSSSYTGVLGKDSDLLEDTVTCWACGNKATASDFEATLEELREIVERDKEHRQEHQPRLEEIESKIEETKRARRRVKDLEAEVSDLENSLEQRRESLRTKRSALEDICNELDTVDEALSEHETERESEVTDLQKEIEEVRVDLHTTRSEAERLESSIEELEDRLDQRDRKEAELEDLSEEIVKLSDHIRTFEQDLQEQFNDAINELIDLLEYDRLERVWLDSDFTLVIARETDGIVREDEIGHLSESERETIGLVLALAGYVAYDVDEIAPVLLIDTLGAFDNDSLGNLIAYFTDQVPLLITALLPESASAVDQLLSDDAVVAPPIEEAT